MLGFERLPRLRWSSYRPVWGAGSYGTRCDSRTVLVRLAAGGIL